jgi:Flp pilus assembly protein TadD
MRRLFTRRAAPDLSREGPDLPVHEGDLWGPDADEGPALRPFASEFPALPPTASMVGEAATLTDSAFQRAHEQEQLGRRLDAIMTLRQLLTDDPAHVAGRIRLAHLLETTGDPDAALQLLSDGLSRSPDNRQLRGERGAHLCRHGRHAEAEADLLAAIDGQAPSAEATLYLGLSLLRRGRHAEAVPYLEQAAGINPTDGLVALHLGEARFQAGDYDGALAALTTAAQLTPADPRPFALAGRLLDRLGRAEEAMEMHRQARLAGRA